MLTETLESDFFSHLVVIVNDVRFLLLLLCFTFFFPSPWLLAIKTPILPCNFEAYAAVARDERFLRLSLEC